MPLSPNFGGHGFCNEALLAVLSVCVRFERKWYFKSCITFSGGGKKRNVLFNLVTSLFVELLALCCNAVFFHLYLSFGNYKNVIIDGFCDQYLLHFLCATWFLLINVQRINLPSCRRRRGHTHLGQRGSRTRALRGHRQHSGDAQADSGGCSIHVYPERDPWEDDNEEGRDVHLDQVVAHLTFQMELHLNTGEFTCRHIVIFLTTLLEWE